MDGGPDQRSTFEDDLWRVYDYTFIRNVNQFLKGLRETEVLKDSEKAPLEGEARFYVLGVISICAVVWAVCR